MEWPWQRFDAFFQAFARRKAVESLEARKLAMLSGLHGNSNMSGDDLGKAVEQLEESFKTATNAIYGLVDEEEIDQSNPFFGQIKVPEISQSGVGGGMHEGIEVG